MKKIGIYIHIPFCTAKCSYCDFASFSAPENLQRQYVAALKKEIALRCGEQGEVFKNGDNDENTEKDFICSLCGIPKSEKNAENYLVTNQSTSNILAENANIDLQTPINNEIIKKINGFYSKTCENNEHNTDAQNYGIFQAKNNKAGEKLTVDTIFIGGGTPSALYRGGLSEIIAELSIHTNLKPEEFTVEANPESVTPEFVEECKSIGVDRISLGLQTAAPRLLRNLRRHTFDDFARAVELIRGQGISNINADIMLGLPDQTDADVLDTVGRLIEMKIPHISAYSLKVEEGTPLFKSGFRPDDDISAEHYKIVCDLLIGRKTTQYNDNITNNTSTNGDKTTKQWVRIDENNEKISLAKVNSGILGANYHRYEVSNFAKAGYECKHNQKYWTLQHYLGLGLSASSYHSASSCGYEKRTTNTRDLSAYINGNYTEFCEDARPNFLTEYIMLGLRTSRGISRKILNKHGVQIQKSPAFQKFFKSKVLHLNGDNITLNPEYFYVMNSVISELI